MFEHRQIEKSSKKPCVSRCHPSCACVCQLSLSVWYEKSISQMGALATVINSSSSVTAESPLGCVWRSQCEMHLFKFYRRWTQELLRIRLTRRQSYSLIRSFLAVASSAYLKGNFICRAAVSWRSCTQDREIISLTLMHYLEFISSMNIFWITAVYLSSCT